MHRKKATHTGKFNQDLTADSYFNIFPTSRKHKDTAESHIYLFSSSHHRTTLHKPVIIWCIIACTEKHYHCNPSIDISPFYYTAMSFILWHMNDVQLLPKIQHCTYGCCYWVGIFIQSQRFWSKKFRSYKCAKSFRLWCGPTDAISLVATCMSA